MTVSPRDRLAIVGVVTVVAGLGLAALFFARSQAVPPLATPAIVLPAEEPRMGDLDPEQRLRLLDQLQASETERYGATEAARRRRLREQLLEQRAP